MEEKKINMDVATLRLRFVKNELLNLFADFKNVEELSIEDYRHFVTLITSVQESLLRIDGVLRCVSVPCDCVFMKRI